MTIWLSRDFNIFIEGTVFPDVLPEYLQEESEEIVYFDVYCGKSIISGK